MDLVLGSHSQACSLGEISHLPKNLALNTPCTCGQPVRSCPFWSRVIELLSKRGHDVRDNPYSLNLGYTRASRVVDVNRQTKWYLAKRKMVHAMAYSAYRGGHLTAAIADRILGPSTVQRRQLYEAVLEVSGARTLVDSSKCYLTGVSLYKAAPESVRIILLTRDGRGCVYSNIKRNVAVRHAAAAWKNYYSHALPLLNKHVDPEHIYHVRYENLVSDPETEFMGICKFLKLRYEEKMLDYGSGEHHITNGNNMRFSPGASITGDYGWRRYMSPRDVSYFEKVAGSLNRRLGYE